jgi:Dolichyl-phosphate-mannose-protein mannosyltransferase
MIRTAIRRHWPLLLLLVPATALRAIVLAAYHPALIFPDSVRYVQYAHNFAHGHWTPDGERQSGYSILIIPPVALNALWLIPLIQHLAGLATAILSYAILIRLGARRWLAALATIPVLFDPLQLILEQYVLTDIWTALLLLAALAILAWPGQNRQGSRAAKAAAAAGLLLGLAVTFRDQELIMIIPAAVYVLAVMKGPPRQRLRTLAALIAAFAVPVAGYLGWFDASHGRWNFSTFTGAFLYGRVAGFADCTGLTLPVYERSLCPTQPAAQRVADFYTWNPASPQWTFTPPPGWSRDSVVEDFSLRILEHQPLAYAQAAARDFWYGFSPVRGPGPERYPLAYYLQFQTHIKPDTQANASLAAIGIKPPKSRPAIARFLHGYGKYFYIPGPVFAAGLLLGLAGCLMPSKRRSPACVLFTASAIVVLIPPALFATFDWRYQLPQLTLAPIAAVLAATAITARTSTAGTVAQDRPASAEIDLPAPPAR